LIENGKTLLLKIEDIHPNDGYINEKEKIVGKWFEAVLTTSNTQYDGWSMIAGSFVDKTGIEGLDNATQDFPIVISIAKYSL